MDIKEAEGNKELRIKVREMESRWAWVICGAAFITTTITDGIVFSFSVFIDELVVHYDSDHKTIGFLGSTLLCLSCGLAGIIGSSLTKLLGCRVAAILSVLATCLGMLVTVAVDNLITTYIFYGVLSGLGAGVTLQQAMNIIPQWFDHHGSLAFGLSTCGAGLGTLFFVSLAQYLIDQYSWKGALLILCGISLNCLPCVLLFRSNDQDLLNLKVDNSFGSQGKIVSPVHHSTNDFNDRHLESKNSTCTEINSEQQAVKIITSESEMKKLSFNENVTSKYIFLIYPVIFILYLGLYVPHIFLFDRYTKIALEQGDQSLVRKIPLIISLAGIPSSFFRILTGWVADKKFIRKSVLFLAVAMFAGVYSVVSRYFKNSVTMILYSLETGLTTGILECILPLICLELFPLKFSIMALGWLMFFKGLGILIGSPMAGLIFDCHKNYDAAFYLSGSCLIASSLLSLPIILFGKK